MTARRTAFHALRFLLPAAAGIASAIAAHAQAFPAGPVRIIVPARMHSADYNVATIFAEGLSQELGNRVIVDAHGADGVASFTASARDGHTLLLARDTVLTRDPHSTPKTALSEADLGTMVVVAEEVLVLACSAESGIRSGADWRSRRKPEKLRLGVLDDPTHTAYAFELARGEPSRFAAAAYPGVEELGQAVLGKAIDCALLPVKWALDKVRRSALAAVAVSTPDKAPQLPDVPTLSAALGIGTRTDAYMLATQAGQPKAIDDAVVRATKRTLGSQQVRRRLESEGFVVTSMTAEETKAFVLRRHADWGERLKGRR